MRDGVDHINVYLKGRTELGRLLSNLAHTPFVLVDGVTFASVEGWWYWQSLVQGYRLPLPLGADLRAAHGVDAKRLGKQLHGRRIAIAPTRVKLKAAYHAKLAANPHIAEALRASTLPFEHYYMYSGGRLDNKWGWTGELWADVRRELQVQATTA